MSQWITFQGSRGDRGPVGDPGGPGMAVSVYVTMHAVYRVKQSCIRDIHTYITVMLTQGRTGFTGERGPMGRIGKAVRRVN